MPSTKKLPKIDVAYNVLVDAINEATPEIEALLEERNRLAEAAETLYKLGTYKQHIIVGK